MRRAKTVTAGAAAYGIAALLNGCAVLEVDVDVYKGPLANHEQVQSQQLAVLAIGAKPLLVELRDRVEWEDEPKTKRTRAEEEGWYKEGYIAPKDGVNRLKNDQARRINEILGLYEDITETGLAIYINEGRRRFRMYKEHRKTLVPEQDRGAWKELDQRPIRTAQSLSEQPPFNALAAPEQDKVAAWINGLGDRYRAFLNPLSMSTSRRRPIKALFEHVQLIEEALGPRRDVREFLIPGLDRPELPSINWMYAKLRDRAFVKAQASLLLEDKQARRRFIDRVNAIGDAFVGARKELESVLRLGLDAIELVNTPSVADRLPQHDEVNRIIAEVIATVIQPKRLSEALGDTSIEEELRNEVKSRWEKELPENFLSATEWRSHGDYVTAARALRAAIERAPTPMARALRRIHLAVRDTTPPISEWTFGITRGPSIGPEELAELDQLRISLNRLEQILAGSLAGGRLPLGIETLITMYLKTNYDLQDPADPNVVAARERMIDALVRFAEKLLVIANNSSLLDTPDTDQAFELDPKLLDHVLVLQSIGNSIVIQADYLAQRKDYYASNRERWRSELRAVQKIVPDERYAEPFDEILEGARPDPREIVDQLIALVRADYVATIVAGGLEPPPEGEPPDEFPSLSPEAAARADRLLAALEALYHVRGDMAFLPPAMAYLRSSTAATSLDRTANRAWDNMLGRQALRAIPFAPQWRDYIFKNQARRARLVSEIDAQHWQNVNRIRVAASGTTNFILAKDDIGNWYVKGYSGDPKPIIEAGKKVALYRASARLGANLLADPSDTTVSPTTIQSDYQRLDARYRQQAVDDFGRIQESASDLADRIKGAWRADDILQPHVDRLVQLALDEPAAALVSHFSTTPSPADPELFAHLVGGMEAFLEFHESVLESIGSFEPELPALESELEPARSDLLRANTALEDANREQREADATLEAASALAERLADEAQAAGATAEQKQLASEAESERQRATRTALEKARAAEDARRAAETAQANLDDASAALEAQIAAIRKTAGQQLRTIVGDDLFGFVGLRHGAARAQKASLEALSQRAST